MSTSELRATRPAIQSDVHRALLAEGQRQTRRDSALMWMMRLGVIVIIVGVWALAHRFEWMNPAFISDPRSVASSFYHLVTRGHIWSDVWATSKAALIGLTIGSSAGILSGLLLSEFPLLRRAVNPIITLANALPRPALAPIFLVWFGLGLAAKVAVSISIVYFILLINTMAGVDSADADRTMLSKTLGMTRLQRFRFVQLPTAAPAIVAGLRLGAVYSVLGAVVAEMVASRDGLGLRLVEATNQFDIASSFAILFMLALLAYVLDWSIGLVQRRLQWTPN